MSTRSLQIDPTGARRGSAMLLALALLLVGCAQTPGATGAGGSLGADPTAPLAALSEFQWAVWSNAGLFLIADAGYLYAAESAGSGILESIPPRIAVRLLHSGESRVVPLSELLAPHAAAAERWRLQRHSGDGGWTDQPRHRFDGDGFAVEGAANVPLNEFDSIRFAPR